MLRSGDELTQISPTSGGYIIEAKVQLNPLDSAQRIKPSDVKAGMTASLDILTGRRSLLTFIAKPITRAFSGALGQK